MVVFSINKHMPTHANTCKLGKLCDFFALESFHP
jgi:hypothetical protein